MSTRVEAGPDGCEGAGRKLLERPQAAPSTLPLPRHPPAAPLLPSAPVSDRLEVGQVRAAHKLLQGAQVPAVGKGVGQLGVDGRVLDALADHEEVLGQVVVLPTLRSTNGMGGKGTAVRGGGCCEADREEALGQVIALPTSQYQPGRRGVLL